MSWVGVETLLTSEQKDLDTLDTHRRNVTVVSVGVGIIIITVVRAHAHSLIYIT